jgi:hypothetical protein
MGCIPEDLFQVAVVFEGAFKWSDDVRQPQALAGSAEEMPAAHNAKTQNLDPRNSSLNRLKQHLTFAHPPTHCNGDILIAIPSR